MRQKPKASNHQASRRQSYAQALEKAMETLWTPDAVRLTKDLAEQIHTMTTNPIRPQHE